MAEKLTLDLGKILEEYGEEVGRVMDSAIKKVGQESVEKLKATSPKKTGRYAKGWRLKRVEAGRNSCSFVVHNLTDYQLTHLLENGHITRNKKGTYGRTPAHPHIKPVEEWANQELVREIERELSK